jgi:hypothetical protein
LRFFPGRHPGSGDPNDAEKHGKVRMHLSQAAGKAFILAIPIKIHDKFIKNTEAIIVNIMKNGDYDFGL